jgi:hypothetical protein
MGSHVPDSLPQKNNHRHYLLREWHGEVSKNLLFFSRLGRRTGLFHVSRKEEKPFFERKSRGFVSPCL